ncbi:MAG: hypothetical protein ACJ76Z_09680, partial [Thermoleophilaceae bacterium]
GENTSGVSPATSLNDYASDVDCGTKGTSATTSKAVTLAYGDDVTCIITNHRKPEIKVVKHLDPTTDGGRFDLKIDTNTFTNNNTGYGNNGDTGFQQVATGTHTASEVAHIGSSLSNYASDVDCGTKGSESGTSHQFSVSYGDQVTCIITNHRLPKLTVVKHLDPTTDGGKFNLSISHTANNASVTDFTTATGTPNGVGNNGTTGAQTLTPGSFTAGENTSGVSPATSLSNYDSDVDCGTKGTSATTSKAVTLAYGDDVTCIITNHRLPELKVVKVLDPSTDKGRFDLKIDTNTFTNDGTGYGDGGDTGFQQVSADSHTVTEAAHSSATDLGDYASKVTCDSGKGGVNPGRSYTLSLNYGDLVTCTITNTLIPIHVTIDKRGPDVAHDGDKIVYDIYVTNPASEANPTPTPLQNVKVTDAITDPATGKASSHGCDGGGDPTFVDGDTNNDSKLQSTETWHYTCAYTVQHGDENGSHNVVNVATVTATDGSDHHVTSTDDATTLVIHPAIAIDKTGPATAQAGDAVGYTLTVTNPGDTPLSDPSVKVADAKCNGTPVALLSKGGDKTTDTLDPGDVWTYSCSVQTAIGDEAIHNEASVTGCDRLDKCVNANDTADTTLTQPAQLVLPERIVPGTAQLLGPTGCVGKAFNARVRGSKIATAVFILDGKIVKRVKNTSNATLIQLRVNPKKLRVGVHRLVVNVTFQAGSGTKPKTMRLSFQRCAKKLAAPRFTG